MTSFAHIGSGIAVSASIQHFVFKDEIALPTIIIGAIFGLLPDFDSLFAVLFGRWSPGSGMLTHHRYFTHTPIFFLLIASIIWLAVDWKWAFVFFAVTFVHLLMDSWGTDDGIMWLWPISTKQLSIYPIDIHAGGIFGIDFYIRYIKTSQLIVPEMIFIVSGLFVVLWFLLRRYYPI